MVIITTESKEDQDFMKKVTKELSKLIELEKNLHRLIRSGEAGGYSFLHTPLREFAEILEREFNVI